MTKLQSDHLIIPRLERDGIAISAVEWTGALEAELLAEEASIIGESWSNKRKAQFILGRTAAHRALNALGEDLSPILRKQDDGPKWPEHLTGSIAHCDDVGVAAAASKQKYRSIGIDLERISDRALKVIPRIAGPDEEARIRASSTPERDALLLFSIKESVYKALAPLLNRYIAFHEVSCTASSASAAELSVVITPNAALADDLQGLSLQGKAAFSDSLILSLVWVV